MEVCEQEPPSSLEGPLAQSILTPKHTTATKGMFWSISEDRTSALIKINVCCIDMIHVYCTFDIIILYTCCIKSTVYSKLVLHTRCWAGLTTKGLIAVKSWCYYDVTVHDDTKENFQDVLKNASIPFMYFEHKLYLVGQNLSTHITPILLLAKRPIPLVAVHNRHHDWRRLFKDDYFPGPCRG